MPTFTNWKISHENADFWLPVKSRSASNSGVWSWVAASTFGEDYLLPKQSSHLVCHLFCFWIPCLLRSFTSPLLAFEFATLVFWFQGIGMCLLVNRRPRDLLRSFGLIAWSTYRSIHIRLETRPPQQCFQNRGCCNSISISGPCLKLFSCTSSMTEIPMLKYLGQGQVRLYRCLINMIFKRVCVPQSMWSLSRSIHTVLLPKIDLLRMSLYS